MPSSPPFPELYAYPYFGGRSEVEIRFADEGGDHGRGLIDGVYIVEVIGLKGRIYI
jgi:hypothetical protein